MTIGSRSRFAACSRRSPSKSFPAHEGDTREHAAASDRSGDRLARRATRSRRLRATQRARLRPRRARLARDEPPALGLGARARRALVAAGSALRAWATLYNRYAQGGERKSLATGGPYSWLRNPLYVANSLGAARRLRRLGPLGLAAGRRALVRRGLHAHGPPRGAAPAREVRQRLRGLLRARRALAAAAARRAAARRVGRLPAGARRAVALALHPRAVPAPRPPEPAAAASGTVGISHRTPEDRHGQPVRALPRHRHRHPHHRARRRLDEPARRRSGATRCRT